MERSERWTRSRFVKWRQPYVPGDIVLANTAHAQNSVGRPSHKGSMLVLTETNGGETETPVEKLVEWVLPVKVARRVTSELVWQIDMVMKVRSERRSLRGRSLAAYDY